MNDHKGVADAIEKIKKDRRVVTQTIDLLKNNPQMERNMTNMAQEMAGGQMTMGMETSLKERRRMLNRQALIKSQMKMNLSEDDIRCVVMYPKGKLGSTVVNLKQIDADDKWSVGAAAIGKLNFITICDSSVGLYNKNMNKKASSIMGTPAYGLVTFVLLDDQYNPVDLLVKCFPSTTAPVKEDERSLPVKEDERSLPV